MTNRVSRFVAFSLFLLSIAAFAQAPKTPSGHPRLAARYVKMPDGVRIAIDVWLPEALESGRKIPTIMRSTRYWRAQDRHGVPIEEDSNHRMASVINEGGYAYVCVDARGTGASFGTRAYEVTEDEVRDYGEIVDWIVEQSWSNGRVGAMGVSYDGDTAEMLMVNKHPAVKAVAPLYPDFNARDQLIYPGNVFLNFFTDDWGQVVWALDMNDVCGVMGVKGADCEKAKKRTRGVKPVDGDKDLRLLAQAVEEHKTNMRVDEAASRIYQCHLVLWPG